MNEEPTVVEENKPIIKEVVEIKKLEVKPIQIDERMKELVENKFNSYKKALTYFIQNGFSEQAEDAQKKLSILNKEKLKVEKGETIEEFELPLDITPDYINNCNTQERTKKYYTIAKDFTERKNKLNQDLQDFAGKIKLLDKRQLEKSVSIFLSSLNRKQVLN